MRNERAARVARGSAIAGFATLTASLAHTLGGGAPPGLLAIALALAFSVPFAIATVGSRGGITRAGIAALGAQLALHALYSLGTTSATVLTDVSGRTLSSQAHAHTHTYAGATGLPAAGEAAGALAGPPAAPAIAAHGAHPGMWMFVTHALAAALTIAFIVGADRVLAAVTTSARGIRIAFVLTRAPLGAARPAARPVHFLVRAIGAADDLHLLAAPRRGPPMKLAAA